VQKDRLDIPPIATFWGDKCQKTGDKYPLLHTKKRFEIPLFARQFVDLYLIVQKGGSFALYGWFWAILGDSWCFLQL
jgi:hypothetical protein